MFSNAMHCVFLCLPEFMSKLSHQLTALRSEALGRELKSESGVPADGLCALMKRPGGRVHPPLFSYQHSEDMAGCPSCRAGVSQRVSQEESSPHQTPTLTEL